ncbi:hypothetical protein B0T24DRAFT_645438 [Lasiosphaeria ovina]|uniref:Peptidase S8/S53 domain-containing protein n=1 Tax=Lasiosphaeria ovina TaxID=92902 RepID=A0AAE0NK04_9PEZI|nr:hypothetical protein B0T24DRAFT_645438 [Lasiosphaeria ovina]
MDRFCLVRLAQQTFPWLSVQVTRVASQKKRRLERDGLIQHLLARLEAVLSVSAPVAKMHVWNRRPNPPSPAHLAFPLLADTAAALEDANEGGLKGGQALASIESVIRNALLMGKADYQGIFLAFVEVSKIGKEKDEFDEAPDSELPPENDDFAGYENSCRCSRQDLNDRHWARLRLKPLYRANTDNQIPFDMSFSASPNPHRTLQFEWQDVQVLVPTSKPSRRVQWAQEPAPAAHVGANQPSEADNEAYERVETLCTLISGRYGSLLCLKADRDRLMVLREASDLVSRHNAQHDASAGLHLGQVLEQFNMRHGMRPVLAYVLAKAVWYYYDSEWMSMSMTEDSVYFMGEILEDEVTYFFKPYLSAQLPPEGGNQIIECRQVVGMIHKYPRVLALGIMLVEIATGRQFEVEGHPDHWDPKTVNQQLLSLKKHLNSGEFHEDCRFPRYKAAVSKCLDPMLFRNAPFNHRKPAENLEQRRSILYSEIVDPLRQLIEGTGWDAELDEIERTPLVPKPRAKTAPKSLASLTISEVTSPMAQESDSWLEQVAVLNQMLKRERRKASARGTPFKIAILDTGYDENASAFDVHGRSRKIKAWKDFISRSPNPVDTDGHGTHLLTLLLQLECPANIYVARVTESSKTLKSAERSIAEAIRTAASEWDVDFISLSFGFPRHIKGIWEAIADAVHMKRGAITFFAAANNDGFNSREMFPANLGESVISVRGTDRAGSFDPRYNPPTSSDEPVFGTLGVDVLSDWPRVEDGKHMSGCSVATPIAVAIAVMLLEYAAARPHEFELGDLRLMRTRRGVFEMFKEIGIHAGDRRYYVAPFNFFKLSEDIRLAKMKAALGRHPERW